MVAMAKVAVTTMRMVATTKVSMMMVSMTMRTAAKTTVSRKMRMVAMTMVVMPIFTMWKRVILLLEMKKWTNQIAVRELARSFKLHFKNRVISIFSARVLCVPLSVTTIVITIIEGLFYLVHD